MIMKSAVLTSLILPKLRATLGYEADDFRGSECQESPKPQVIVGRGQDIYFEVTKRVNLTKEDACFCMAATFGGLLLDHFLCLMQPHHCIKTLMNTPFQRNEQIKTKIAS